MFLPFEELRSLDLFANKLFGFAENEGFGKLSKLRHLENLDLGINHFDASSLSSLSEISSLKSLSFQGMIVFRESNNPNELIDLFGNSLSGTIDLQDFQNLTNLKKLSLGQNEIESIRSSDGNGRQVRLINLELDLSQNSFNNSIWAELSGFSNLKFLDISYNQLKGSVDIKGVTLKQLIT
ncbi:hypothetical protein PTKIN_Ptkin09bG0270600 [Pterospermum kingtungense]